MMAAEKCTIRLWGTGSASREFLYAGDCARAIAVSLEKRTGPEPINLGTGREISIRELAELIKSIGGYDAQIEWDTSKPDGQPRRSLDVTRADTVLRWRASTSLEEMIRRTIYWYRNNK
jgi:GDP-L-fucose synthase